MPQPDENAERIQEMWRTLLSGDPATLPLEFVDPAVTYEDDILPDHAGETYSGHEGMQRAWSRALEPFDQETIENDIVWARGTGDEVVTCHHVRGRGRGSGIELEFDYAYLWRLRAGRITYCRSFREPADALAAADLD
jgi:ketosteroid isomerase-like protein